MKKIGVLLGSTSCSKYLYETISELANDEHVELYFLINQVQPQSQQGLLAKLKGKLAKIGLMGFLQRLMFKIITLVEYKLLSRFKARLRMLTQMESIDAFINDNVVYIKPSFSKSGLLVRYKDEQLDKIKALELDMMVRGNAPGIYRGEVLKAAKDGIISFHHGDNRWNRGAPPAFWEVYRRKPSTGFIIQMLTEELDGGQVIFRGDVATLRTYTENLEKLYTESNSYLAQTILSYAKTGLLPTPEEQLPFGGKILKTPTMTTSANYIFKTITLFATLVFKRVVLRKYNRWGVGFVPGSWRNLIFRKGVRIKNPPRRFFADPFVITRDGRTICYVEDFSQDTGLGCITAIEILDKKSYKILGPVIEEPFHMSFPYLIEFDGELYMVPETSDGKVLRLYKCVDYPMKWERQKDIFTDVQWVDTMIFQREDRWWMLTNEVTKGGSEYCAQLMAYHSDHPFDGQWIPHTQNPLIFDSNVGRNGGILDVDKPYPVRVRQKQGAGAYGVGLTLARINQLTPTEFSETQIGEVDPEFFDDIAGCHHINTDGHYTVFDFRRHDTLD